MCSFSSFFKRPVAEAYRRRCPCFYAFVLAFVSVTTLFFKDMFAVSCLEAGVSHAFPGGLPNDATAALCEYHRVGTPGILVGIPHVGALLCMSRGVYHA